MTAKSEWLLYGANGYTGELIARHAVERGMRPILAGRKAEAIQKLADELDCPSRVFPLDDGASVAGHLKNVAAVLNCAGPFSRTAKPMIEGCLSAGASYLDITGEIEVIELAALRGSRAMQAGILLIPAVGFDVVPSDCLAAMLAERLPGAQRLELAFSSLPQLSPGTTKTMLEQMPSGGRVRIDGKIQAVPTAWKTKEIPFREGSLSAMTIPWGDVASAFHSTGIPNIEVYMAVPPGQIAWARRLRPMMGLLKLGPVKSLLAGIIERRVTGPTAAQRASGRSSFWGRVSFAAGREVTATMVTANGYHLTVLTAVKAVERVLQGGIAPGFHTPSQAFGKDFILDVPGTDFRWEEPRQAGNA